VLINPAEMDARMDAGLDTFALSIPPGFQRDVLAGRSPALQLNVDATRMGQAFTGSAYIQTIVTGEVEAFLHGRRAAPASPVDLVLRTRFNPNLTKAWFTAVVQVINQVTLLSIVLAGAALIREREHGTIEHLLAMPVTPLQIVLSKVWSMGLVVLAAAGLSLLAVVEGFLRVPIEGSVGLFLGGTALHLFATTSLAIALASVGRTMPQFALLLMLVVFPLEMLSGGRTPRESMPQFVQWIMLAAPTTHFVALGQAILFRGAGLSVIWPQYAALAVIGAALFVLSLARFRRTIGAMA
jgi:ABC-2 type transport system permease protein